MSLNDNRHIPNNNNNHNLHHSNNNSMSAPTTATTDDNEEHTDTTTTITTTTTASPSSPNNRKRKWMNNALSSSPSSSSSSSTSSSSSSSPGVHDNNNNNNNIEQQDEQQSQQDDCLHHRTKRPRTMMDSTVRSVVVDISDDDEEEASHHYHHHNNHNISSSSSSSGSNNNNNEASSELNNMNVESVNHDDNNNNNDDDCKMECCVCYDTVEKQGCLDSCQHEFCFKCIHQWSEKSNECPVCKRRFTSITPKMVSLSSSDEKLQSPSSSALDNNTSSSSVVHNHSSDSNITTVIVPHRNFRLVDEEDDGGEYDDDDDDDDDDDHQAHRSMISFIRFFGGESSSSSDESDDDDDDDEGNDGGLNAGYVYNPYHAPYDNPYHGSDSDSDSDEDYTDSEETNDGATYLFEEGHTMRPMAPMMNFPLFPNHQQLSRFRTHENMNNGTTQHQMAYLPGFIYPFFPPAPAVSNRPEDPIVISDSDSEGPNTAVVADSRQVPSPVNRLTDQDDIHLGALTTTSSQQQTTAPSRQHSLALDPNRYYPRSNYYEPLVPHNLGTPSHQLPDRLSHDPLSFYLRSNSNINQQQLPPPPRQSQETHFRATPFFPASTPMNFNPQISTPTYPFLAPHIPAHRSSDSGRTMPPISRLYDPPQPVLGESLPQMPQTQNTTDIYEQINNRLFGSTTRSSAAIHTQMREAFRELSNLATPRHNSHGN